MRNLKEDILRQLEKPMTCLMDYYPLRIKNVSLVDKLVRRLVYDFKDGKSFEVDVFARETADNLIRMYGTECSDIVFSCVPASSAEKNEIRYKSFCEKVCELTGAVNGYEHVRVVGERLAIHENRSKEKEIREVNIIEFDESWFKGRKVVLFDDVITRGISYATYAGRLESIGAEVLGGIFLARTHYKI